MIDTSAVVAILKAEPNAGALSTALDRATTRLISAATMVELGMVIESSAPISGRESIMRIIERCDVMPVDARAAVRAMEGWRSFGKGNHPAGLNFGDCFTYALAKEANLPILCIGNDFVRTDVAVVDLEMIGNES